MFVSISVVVIRLCVAKAAWWKDDMHGCTRGKRGRIRGLPVPSAPGTLLPTISAFQPASAIQSTMTYRTAVDKCHT